MAEFTESTFTTYSGWSFNTAVASPITTCGSLGSIFGGYNAFGTNQIYKSYATDYPHYSAVISFNFLKVDSWDMTPLDYVDVYLPLYSTFRTRIIQTMFHTVSFVRICGTPGFDDELKAMSYTVNSHTSTTFELKFIALFDSLPDDESWGIRDIRISLKMCDTTCKTCSGPASNNCLTCLTNAVLSSSTCACRDYYYHKPHGSPPTPFSGSTSGSCARCDITCKTCSGGTSTDCLTCDSPDSPSGGTCTRPSSKIFFVNVNL